MKMSELQEGDLGKVDHQLFIVRMRCPTDTRASGVTDVVFDGGSRKTYIWEIEDPEVRRLGRGELITKIVVKEMG